MCPARSASPVCHFLIEFWNILSLLALAAPSSLLPSPLSVSSELLCPGLLHPLLCGQGKGLGGTPQGMLCPQALKSWRVLVLSLQVWHF